jgi:hypothetical protein
MDADRLCHSLPGRSFRSAGHRQCVDIHQGLEDIAGQDHIAHHFSHFAIPDHVAIGGAEGEHLHGGLTAD